MYQVEECKTAEDEIRLWHVIDEQAHEVHGPVESRHLCQEWIAQQPITLAEAAQCYPLAYSTLAEAVREGRLQARRSGATWLTTPAAIEDAIEAGGLQPRRMTVAELAEAVYQQLCREIASYPETKRAEILAWLDDGTVVYERSSDVRAVAHDWLMYDQ